MKYRYFVSWNYPDGNGCSVIERNRKIKSHEDIREIAYVIEREHEINNVIIMNFIRL